MGKIYCIIGKSATGKDTIYQRLLQNETLGLQRIVLYTTRPIREGEREGVEYHFTDEKGFFQMQKDGKIVECRSYNTIYGIWYYFMAKDEQLDLENCNYLITGTLESYEKTRDYFGGDKVIPIYVEVEDGERLTRALHREQKQSVPHYEEMCRRFLTDSQDFTEEKLKTAGIQKRFDNRELETCIQAITNEIQNSL